jgi:hypothetical protein
MAAMTIAGNSRGVQYMMADHFKCEAFINKI